MRLTEIALPGCYEIQTNPLEDLRGRFVKVFHKEIFANLGLEINFAEEYCSVSYHRVLRGLHFQVPPHEHLKLVYCVEGRVLDVVVDLRVGSPQYGKFATIELSAQKGNMLYIAPGLAHGFYVLTDKAIMIYKVTSVYSAEHDTGILWNSAGIPWPDPQPIISPRDRGFVTLSEFLSPFRYEKPPA